MSEKQCLFRSMSAEAGKICTHSFELSDFVNVGLKVPLCGDVERALSGVLRVELDQQLAELFRLDSYLPLVFGVEGILIVVAIEAFAITVAVVTVTEAIVQVALRISRWKLLKLKPEACTIHHQVV